MVKPVEAFVVLRSHVDERDVGRDGPRNDFHHDDASDVGVDDDLEGAHYGLAVGIALEEPLTAVHQRRDRPPHRDLVEQRGETVHPDAEGRRAARDRDDAALDHQFGERRFEFFHRGHVAIEVALGE